MGWAREMQETFAPNYSTKLIEPKRKNIQLNKNYQFFVFRDGNVNSKQILFFIKNVMGNQSHMTQFKQVNSHMPGCQHFELQEFHLQKG